MRIGVTGEAVTGVAAAGRFFTSGDIVNGRAPEQAAGPGDIPFGRDTLAGPSRSTPSGSRR